jgi:hypothetical protein
MSFVLEFIGLLMMLVTHLQVKIRNLLEDGRKSDVAIPLVRAEGNTNRRAARPWKTQPAGPVGFSVKGWHCAHPPFHLDPMSPHSLPLQVESVLHSVKSLNLAVRHIVRGKS